MMRRLFWATAGAALGVASYRKAARLARTVWPPEPRSEVSRGVRGAASFARDVRQGMDLYLERYSEPAGPNLRGQHLRGQHLRGQQAHTPRPRRLPRAHAGDGDPGREYPGIDYVKDGR